MGLYMAGCLVCCILDVRSAMTAPFLAIFAFGFFYVSLTSFQGELATRPRREKNPQLSTATSEQSETR